MFESAHTEISGTFVRICSPDLIDQALKRNSPERPAARYNRHGQDALYLAVNEESARVALRKYAKHIDTPLVLVKYKVEACQLVDLRCESLSEYKALAGQNWQDAMAKNSEPTSWQVSDLLRSHQEIGLIDPSRKDPDVWHVTLFRWNEVGAPKVDSVGDPIPVYL
jgi:RES domain-containing protein